MAKSIHDLAWVLYWLEISSAKYISLPTFKLILAQYFRICAVHYEIIHHNITRAASTQIPNTIHNFIGILFFYISTRMVHEAMFSKLEDLV